MRADLGMHKVLPVNPNFPLHTYTTRTCANEAAVNTGKPPHYFHANRGNKKVCVRVCVRERVCVCV